MRVIGFALRFVWLNLAGLLYLGVYGIGRLGTLLEPRARRKASVARLRGRVLREAMSHLGATFIKLGQVLSTRPDLLEPETIEELKKLQDELPPFPYGDVRRALRDQFGGPIVDRLPILDEEPVAAASVAQVHRAVRHDGREVAVKVLRPDVRAKIERDVAILRAGARTLALHPKIRLSDPVGHLEHFVQGILDQTDLRLEAKNSHLFRELFRDEPNVVFPLVHDDLSGERVLVMDFVRGLKVDALSEGDHKEVADRLSKIFLDMCFKHGVVHADLHPGNFLILPDRRVAVFDVGLVKHLSEALLEEFVDFSRCMAMGTAQDMVRHMQTFHDYMEGTVDWDSMSADMESLVAKFRGMTKAELEMGEMFDEMFALGRKYKVRPVIDLTLVIVGMITAEGVGKMIDAEKDQFGELAAYLMPLVLERGLGFGARA